MVLQNKKFQTGATAAFLLAGLLTLTACGEEATSSATTTSGVASPAVSSPALSGSPVATVTNQMRQITFPPLILAEPLTTVPATNAPAQNSQPALPVPATTLPVLPSKPAIDGATAKLPTPTLAQTTRGPVLDSRAGGELVGKTLQKNQAGQNFQLTVKRVERLSRIRDSAGKYYTPADPNGIFLLVLYDVRNNGSQPMAYADFSLRDSQNQLYKTGTNAQLEAAQKNYKLFWDTPQIAPGKAGQQYRVFEVPKNAGGFQLVSQVF